MNFKKIWKFIWYEDSLLSWLVNIIIAIILVKFVIYPGLGLMLGTNYPVVAVVSNSMEHRNLNFDGWWELNKEFYIENGISKDEFKKFDFSKGFNKGDIFVVRNKKEINKGDVIIYNNKLQKTPIIHRVIIIENNEFTTKGDNVNVIQNFEKNIKDEQIFGKAIVKIPYLGWLKVWFNDYVIRLFMR